MAGPGLLSRRERVVLGAHGSDRLDALELVWVGLDPASTEGLQLLAAGGEDV
jgi:hypothetical protein